MATENALNVTSASSGMRRARNNVDHVGTETGLDQEEFMVWCLHITTLCAAAPERFRPAVACETVLHEMNSPNMLPSQFEQVLHQEHVPDGAWTGVLDQ